MGGIPLWVVKKGSSKNLAQVAMLKKILRERLSEYQNIAPISNATFECEPSMAPAPDEQEKQQLLVVAGAAKEKLRASAGADEKRGGGAGAASVGGEAKSKPNGGSNDLSSAPNQPETKGTDDSQELNLAFSEAAKRAKGLKNESRSNLLRLYGACPHILSFT